MMKFRNQITSAACEQLNRICSRVELEPKFVDVAVEDTFSLKAVTPKMWRFRMQSDIK